jgi:glycosyltransferase involved in cell wall biosynthesis
MVGDGPDRSSAEWLANSKGIQNRVQFLGKQERVHELLPVADLMIMPSELDPVLNTLAVGQPLRRGAVRPVAYHQQACRHLLRDA